MNKALGHDNIPAYYLKIAPFSIAPFLLILINYAFTNGIFPNNCKISKVVPIHKNGDTNNPNNFRPISLLTCFSKIFEKIIFKRITRFLNKHDVLNPQQYGFQKGIFTDHAILNPILLKLFRAIDSSTAGLQKPTNLTIYNSKTT